MKKTALSLSLMLVLLTGAMVGCNNVKKAKLDGDDVIFKVGETQVTAADILGFKDSTNSDYTFLETSEGANAVYESVYKTLAQKYVEVTSAIEGAVKEKMDDWNDEVANYANSNGVTTRNATKTLLEQKGFETEAELEASYLLEEQKEELASMFANSNKEPVVTAATGKTTLERYVNATSPMIVKQILVMLGDSSTLANKAAIVADEVDDITSVFKRLALSGSSTNSFKNIAYEESDDGSATYGGNLGIMDTYTAFVSEFKLGLYVSEIIQNKDNWKGSFDANDTLGAVEFEEELFGANGVYAGYTAPTVNIASVASALAYCENDLNVAAQTAANHNKEEDYDAQLYPRNVLFNKYFNFPGIQYLKLDFSNIDAELSALVGEMYDTDDATFIADKVAAIKESDFYNGLENAEYNKINADKLIVDADNNPLVLVKSTYGLHVLSITWSALDHANGAGTTASDAVQYFMYGNNASAVTVSPTYVKAAEFNFGYTNTTVAQNARKTEVSNRVENYLKGGYSSVAASETLYDYEIYQYYYAQAKAAGDITITNAKIEERISDMINITNLSQQQKISRSVSETWDAYIKSIEANLEMRELMY